MKVMRSKLSLLIKDGLKKKLDTKWFKIVNIILVIAIVALLNIDSIIKYFGGDFNEKNNIYVIDNTGKFYDTLNVIYSNQELLSTLNMDVNLVQADKTYNELKSEIEEKENKDIILTIDYADGKYKSNVTSFKYVDAITIEMLNSYLNKIKMDVLLAESNLTNEELSSIYETMDIERTYISEDLDENYEMMETIGNYLIPAFIMPFFFLILLVTQMIGAEINEEKTSKSMEIIISSVSPKIHFLAKMITSNLYAILQCVLLIIYLVLGLALRMVVTGTKLIDSFGTNGSDLLHSFLESGVFDNLLKCLPFIIIMILLSFIAYSLLAGILASMTTSAEDFSQLQTPLMIIIMLGYFLAIMASTYEKSTFIIVLSMVPFISCILSPVLLSLGQITIVHVLISMGLIILVIYLLIKYGLRIYKVGILNYSSSNLWKKMFRSLKTKSV